ncbi:MAG: hypothetical protein ACYTX0_51345, partial [Nostoc sp.]
ETLAESLQRFQPSGSVWLFPSRCGEKPISWRNAYDPTFRTSKRNILMFQSILLIAVSCLRINAENILVGVRSLHNQLFVLHSVA